MLIHAAELQELAIMRETAQIAGRPKSSKQ
jgi:hypothetical protein